MFHVQSLYFPKLSWGMGMNLSSWTRHVWAALKLLLHVLCAQVPTAIVTECVVQCIVGQRT